jgi:hypothetical protein
MSVSVYFSVDGDDVGKLIERGLLEDDELFLRDTSADIKSWLAQIEELIVMLKGRLIMSGGDMLLCRVNESCVEKIIEGLSEIQQTFSFTCSAATGRTLSEVYFALKLAKSKGKNHFVNLLDSNFQAVSKSKIVMIDEIV